MKETIIQFLGCMWLFVCCLIVGCVVLGSAMSPEPTDPPAPKPGPEGDQPPDGSSPARE